MPISINEDMVPDIIDVTFQKCTPAWEISKHTSDFCNLTYLTQGEARYTINGQVIDLAQGSLLALPYNSVSKGTTFPDRLMHCFSVDFSLHNSKNQELELPFPLSSLPGRREDIVHLFNELYFTWTDKYPGYIIKSRGLFLQIIHGFLEQVIYKVTSSSGDIRIAKAIRYMEVHFSEHLSVRMMAKMSGLNSSYFGLLFQKEMGVTFNRWLIQTRVKKAEDMLASGETKLSDIAHACGFTDASHFNKQFKMIKGYPPSHTLSKKF